jgi:high-affinity nickel-transport protein
METFIINSLVLGFTLGFLHALDPDHVVAMTTMVSREKSIRRSSVLGVMWGLGHTTSLALVGLAVLTFQITIPSSMSKGMEMGVALMIILLGGHLIWRSAKEFVLHGHPHSHDGSTHTHIHLHSYGDTTEHDHHTFVPRSSKKTFAIGIIHGLAGSAALTLAVMATMTSALQGMVYIVVFGLGSIGGMLVMSAGMSLPFAMLARRYSHWHGPAQGLVGVVAVLFGLYFGWTINISS